MCRFVLQNNHHVDNISAKMKALKGKVSELERAAEQRKAKLDENSAFLQFNWKADVVESWIGMFVPWEGLDRAERIYMYPV